MATYSSILAWEILWTEEPVRLQSMGSQTVRHDSFSPLSHTHTYTQPFSGSYLTSSSSIMMLFSTPVRTGSHIYELLCPPHVPTNII